MSELVGVGLLFLIIKIIFVAWLQGYRYSKKPENLRLYSEMRIMPEQEFQMKIAWDHSWTMIWAVSGAVLTTVVWLIAWWQTGGVYQRFIHWWAIGPVPMTLSFTFLPGILWYCNWLGQYHQRPMHSKMVNIASVLMISVLGPVAWPAVTVLWLPYRGGEELYYWYCDYLSSRRKLLVVGAKSA